MGFEIKGLDELLEKLDKLAKAESLKDNMGKACALVEGDAKNKAPKGTGELRRSIDSRVEEDGTDIIGKIFSPLEYAPYVEYGTGLYAVNGGRKDVPWAYKDEKTGEIIWTAGQHPQPYMRPALDENRKEIIRLLREGLLK